MSISNTLQSVEEKKSQLAVYEADGKEVRLSPSMVKDYLVSGDASKVTTQEIVMFINLCKYQGLNPFLRDAFLIKYGNSPATIVTSKQALEKRAARCERYQGFEAGIIVRKKDGTTEQRTGTFYLDDEELVGGWARVHVQGFRHPVEAAVSLREYLGRKNDGSVNGQWSGKPATMIRKVAKSQALREAFPNDMQGLYAAEEFGMDDIPEQPVPAEEPIAVQAEVLPEEEDEFASIMEG